MREEINSDPLAFLSGKNEIKLLVFNQILWECVGVFVVQFHWRTGAKQD